MTMSMERLSMAGKVVLITGSTSGIGLATARLLADRGANIVLNYLYDDENPEAVAAEIQGRNVEVLLARADVTSRDQVRSMVEQAIAKFGRIDGLFNNAGGAVGRCSFLEVTPEIWTKAMDLNLTSIFHVSQAVLPHMLAQRYGRIVNTSSIAHRHGGGEGSIPYSAAKGAVLTLTRGLSGEFSRHGILVNAVVPGPIRTRFFRNDPTRLKGREAGAPLGRIGEPEDVAEATAYLLSDAASYITGTALEVAGGF